MTGGVTEFPAPFFLAGAGMIPRGEAGVMVAQTGVVLRIIPKDVYGIFVFKSIAAAILAPPLLKLSYLSLIRSTSAVHDTE